MPKQRHENPHVERLIVELDLLAWESQRARRRRETEAARREREMVALLGVSWEDLSPAELAFRWMLEHDWPRYVAWCESTRAALPAR